MESVLVGVEDSDTGEWVRTKEDPQLCPDCYREGIPQLMYDREGHYYCPRCGNIIVKHGAFQGFGNVLREVRE